MIVNINDEKTPGWKMSFAWQLFKILWSSLAFTKVNKYSQTNTTAVEPQQLKAEAAEKKFPSCSDIINRTCYCPT